jgi:hypothetical protein
MMTVSHLLLVACVFLIQGDEARSQGGKLVFTFLERFLKLYGGLERGDVLGLCLFHSGSLSFSVFDEHVSIDLFSLSLSRCRV